MSTAAAAQPNWIKIEENISKFWREHKLSERAIDPYSIQPEFLILEQPYLADHKPNAQALIAWTIKDALSRYQTLCGWQVKRIYGWNTISPHLQLAAKRKVEASLNQFGENLQLQRFIDIARKTAFDYLFEWEKLFERCGFWIPWQEAAVFHMRDFVNTAWKTVKFLWENHLLTLKPQVVPYCPHCLSPLSWQEAELCKSHVPTQNAYIRLPLLDEPGSSLLVWSNEIWKLTANVAVAVHPEAEYVLIECKEHEGGKEKFILSQQGFQELLTKAGGLIFDSCTVLHTFKGKKLKDVRYRPLFVYITSDQPAYYVILDKEVDIQKGSGIVPYTSLHDRRGFELSKENHLPLISPIQRDGSFFSEAGPWRTRFFKDVESSLLAELSARGLLVWQENTEQEISFCPHCQTPLLPYLEEVCTLNLDLCKTEIQQTCDQISWHPENTANVFQEYLKRYSDWVISRRNLLGIPMPIWLDDNEQSFVIGSLEELANVLQSPAENLPWQLPALDELILIHPQSGRLLHRIPDTIDPAFVIGLLMTIYRQTERINQAVPSVDQPLSYTADLICEPFEAIVPWLSAAQILNTLLYAQPTARRIVSLPLPDSHTAHEDEPDRQLFKEWSALFEQYGADLLRWVIFKQQSPAQNPSFSTEQWVKHSQLFFEDVWKAYTFFITFSREQNWKPLSSVMEFSSTNSGWNLLERWMFSTLQTTLRGVHEALQGYHFHRATFHIELWVKKLTHVFLPLMHQYFWNAPEIQQTHQVLQNLQIMLSALSRILAPFAPFIAEEIYQKVVRVYDPDAPISVHLSSFPTLESDLEDEELNKELDLILHFEEIGKKALEKGETTSKKTYKETVFLLTKPDELFTLEKYQFLLKALLKVKRVSARLKQPELAFEDNEAQLLFTIEDGVQVILIAE